MKLRWVAFAFICALVGATTMACTTKPASTTPATQTSTAPVSQSGQGLVEKLTLEQLTTRAAYILVGQVSAIVSQEEGKGNIYTVVTLSVETVVKGESTQKVVIKVPGGEVNGQKLWVEDTPRFETGERVLVFLEETETGLNMVGGAQGKLTIDEKNMVEGMPLSEFIDQLRNIIAK